jgi:hypothetical protein
VAPAAASTEHAICAVCASAGRTWYGGGVIWSNFSAILSAAALVACSTGGSGAGATAPLDECPDLDYSTCDTLKAACQTKLRELAACIYGVTAPSRVPVRLLTEQQLLDELESERDAAEAPDPADPAALPHVERALVDLKLLQAGELSKSTEFLAGTVKHLSSVYRGAERGIVLIDRGEPQDSVETDAQLIHELVHVLQDAEYDLDTWRSQYPTNPDAALALDSITEGQATFVQYRAWAAMSGTDANSIDWRSTFIKRRQELLDTALADGSPYFVSKATFPDGFGATLAAAAWQAAGPAYHADQFVTPPLTTLEVVAQNLHRDLPSLDTSAFQTPLVTDGYTAVEETVLGAFLLELAAHQLGDASRDPLALPLAWRGDNLSVYAGPSDESAWLWQIQVDDDTTAQALQELAENGGGLTAEAQGDRVFLLGGDDPPPFLLDAGRAFLDAER